MSTDPVSTEPESTEPESLLHSTTDQTLVDSTPSEVAEFTVTDLTTDDFTPTEFLSDDVESISASTTDEEVRSNGPESGLATGDNILAAVVLAVILMTILAIIALSVLIACGYSKKQSKTLPLIVHMTFSPYHAMLNAGKKKASLQNWQTMDMQYADMEYNDAYISTTPNMPLEDNEAYVQTIPYIPMEHNVAYCDNTAVQTQKIQDNVEDSTIETEDSAVYSTIAN